MTFSRGISLAAAGLLGLGFAACTDNPESLHPPPPTDPVPPPPVVRREAVPREIPDNLRAVFELRCAGCHGSDGRSGDGGDLYAAGRRSARNWETFLRNPQTIEPKTRMPAVAGLTDHEYRHFAEWLTRITRNNFRPETGRGKKATSEKNVNRDE